MSNHYNLNQLEGLVCEDYLVLNPENATLFDLIRLLFSNKKREFINSPLELEDELRRFRFRWLVVVSVLAQKVMMQVKKPMANAGDGINWWINLVSHNGGLFGLLLNYLQGNVRKPEKSQENYRSVVGNLDSRVDLDSQPTTGAGNGTFEAALALMSSKLAYENSAFIQNVVENHWKMKLLGSYSFRNVFHENSSTHAFICRTTDKETDLVVVAFRGTGPFDAEDWCTDFNISWHELPGMGKIHSGFMKALGLQNQNGLIGWPKEVETGPGKAQYAYYTIRQVLRDLIKESKREKFIVTGHSLGGALAILFSGVLAIHEEKEVLDRIEGVYTYGQPRVGNREFGEYMKLKLKAYNVRYCRYVYSNDMVPRLPYDDKALFYTHFGPCLFYDSFYLGKVLEEEPNKNYFSLLWMIPNYINAAWELLRGFILPFLHGPSYREGWCLRTYRLIGLLIPGVSAHGPQDYDNLTRLGTLQRGPIDKHDLKSH